MPVKNRGFASGTAPFENSAPHLKRPFGDRYVGAASIWIKRCGPFSRPSSPASWCVSGARAFTDFGRV